LIVTVLTAVVGALVVVVMITAVVERYDRARLRRAQIRARIRDLEAETIAELPPQSQADIRPVRRPPVSRQDREDAVPDPPLALLRALGAGDCVLFVGAGLVAQAGYPTYYELVSRLLAEAEHQEPNGPWQDARRLLRSGEFDSVVDLSRLRLGEEVVSSLMHDAIRQTRAGRSRTLDSLRNLPFAGVVTSDWSGFVVESLGHMSTIRLSPWDAERGVDALRSSTPFVLEASGRSGENSILVTADDMRQATLTDPQYARFLTTLVTTRSVLFMGASPRGIEQFMGAIRRSDGRRRHWALVPREAATAVEEERFLARFGVELLVYDPGESHERATTEFAKRLRARTQVSTGHAHPAEVERLQALRLTNIGPFKSLDLTFGKRTILLGDNGSGKSTVLKAIALALLGDLAPPELAGRMLNTTANRGEVVLDTARDMYSTALLREELDVSVDAQGFAPIQARPWFAIGFPAIRGTSARHPNGPSPQGGGGPSSRDLVPMLDNRPDTRLDDLKQWVVNTEVRADADPGAEQMLRRFFEVVGDLTPGVDFEYRGVDRHTWDVMLTTPDGPISFDLLSRGMTAVLAWIGVLLQRLYEVYEPQDGLPEHQRALLLVDEIDVHLHPGWQHRVLSLLETHFPNVQLIATTHSPLIVGSAGHSEVQLLQRVDGELTVLELPRRFEGWRSDQILTSEAFGMDTTRDPATAARHAEYRELMARGETPQDNTRAAELHDQLDAVMPDQDETPAAREATRLFREWLEERLRDRPYDERDRVIGEAEMYLRRLYTGEEG
jgi:AAA domain, putative AbiEii toxin, Type IV TA system/AAA domain/SIR2-like domain